MRWLTESISCEPGASGNIMNHANIGDQISELNDSYVGIYIVANYK